MSGYFRRMRQRYTSCYQKVESRDSIAVKKSMKKPTKILLLLASLWPFVYMILFFVLIFSSLFFMPAFQEHGSRPPLIILIIFPLHMITILWILALTAFY